jgi:uncharacterized Zn finger protein (UPF0148 family)
MMAARMGMRDVFGAAPRQAVPVMQKSTGEVICKVCQRMFKSEEMLRKHERLSDLHKQNLAKLNGDV